MDNENKNAAPAGLKERLEYNKDFKLDWHDKDEAHDGYQLKWVGKNYARLEAGTAPSTMIFPDVRHNKQAENANSENLFFTGDNLQVLKHLQNCYRNAVKMIYIDPPYNTGSGDFVYKDKFEFSDEKLQSMLGLTEEEVRRLHIINKRSSHSAWLTFMYPRLKIARDLLRDDGVIFISIDDNEQANLKLLCDEIFGEGNFLACAARKTKSQSNKGTFFAPSHDYVLAYAKDISLLPPFSDVEKLNSDAYADYYSNEDSKGKYKVDSLYKSSLDSRPNQRYFIKCPDGSLAVPPGDSFPDTAEDGAQVKPASNRDKVWRWSRDSYSA